MSYVRCRRRWRYWRPVLTSLTISPTTNLGGVLSDKGIGASPPSPGDVRHLVDIKYRGHALTMQHRPLAMSPNILATTFQWSGTDCSQRPANTNHYRWMQPVRHALGAFLLEQGRVAEAEAVFRKDLEQHPGNVWALHGLAECLQKVCSGEGPWIVCYSGICCPRGLEPIPLKRNFPIQKCTSGGNRTGGGGGGGVPREEC
jgi:hypothetical protein